jgi:serine/threonine protein kinase
MCDNIPKTDGSLEVDGGNFIRIPAKKKLTKSFNRVNLPGNTVLKIIGEGGYGSVYKLNEMSVFKRVNQSINGFGVESPLEVYIMAYMKHRFISETYKHILYDNGMVDIYQRLAVSDMRVFSKTYFTEKFCTRKRYNVIRLIWQLCKAVEYLHNNNIIHGDIKASNILIYSENGKYKKGDDLSKLSLKLTDFSLSSFLPDRKLGINNYSFYTSTHRPAEVWNKIPWSYPADIWSLGVTIYEIFYGNTLFSQKSGNKNPKTFNMNLHSIWAENMSSSCKNGLKNSKLVNVSKEWENPENVFINDLIISLMDINPYIRLNISEVLKHHVFDVIREEDKTVPPCEKTKIPKIVRVGGGGNKKVKYKNFKCQQYIADVAKTIQKRQNDKPRIIYLILAYKITSRKIPYSMMRYINYSYVFTENKFLREIKFDLWNDRLKVK